jgi:hypothetical protein
LAHINQIAQARLPISDYINDTRSVMDNVPRLLAAMHFIGSKEFQVEGFLEVVSQLFRTKQLLATKSTVCFSLLFSFFIGFASSRSDFSFNSQLRMDPLLQLPGIDNNAVEKATNELGDEASLMWELRNSSRANAEQLLKKINRSSKGFASTLDSLYSLPKVTVLEAHIVHNVDKATAKSRGTLKLKIEVNRRQRKGRQVDEPTTLGLVLGSANRRLLLGYNEVSINRNGTWSIEKELDFDWNAARADGGEGSGVVILRLLLDSIKGLDSERSINLISSTRS